MDTEELVEIFSRDDYPKDQQELFSRIDLLTADSLFDETFYAQAAGVTGSRAELIGHYMTVGEAALLSPSREFDVRFYQFIYPDVAQSDMGPFFHYISYGRAERRYANRMQLRHDAERVAASGLFDTRIYASNRGRPAMTGLSEIEDYLAARDHSAPIGEAFDSSFYKNAYEDALFGHSFPLLHYIDVGHLQLRVRNRHELAHILRAEQFRFDERFYLSQFRIGEAPARPLEHYILTGSRMELDPAPDFATDYYLRRYPDIATCGTHPFHHFSTHGFSEGRLGRPDFSPMTSLGELPFDISKPTILIANHEASRTGAPLVGLHVAARLSETHNVVSYLGRSGPILAEFGACSCLMVAGPLSPLDAEYLLKELKITHHLSAVLLNSAETDVFAPAALHADLPSVALIHEFADYVLPLGRISGLVEMVDRVIVPASLVQESLQAEVLATRGGHANNIIVRHQGHLSQLPKGDKAEPDLARDQILDLVGKNAGRKPKIVLGAGFVQMRKGVDLFVQTAAEVRRLYGEHFRFVWVGDGYDPKMNEQYSTWLAAMVCRLDLEGHVFFLPAQSSLDTLFAVSDVFYLPSRLDPFPNVVLDAWCAGRAVVCFDRATGVAEVLRDRPGHKAAAGAAVAYCNVGEAAEALVRAFRPTEAVSAKLAQARFNFGDYMTVIREQLVAATTLRAEAKRITEAVVASGLFDASFHDNAPLPVEQRTLRGAVRAYVARGQKGLTCNNPRPGFNEGLARGKLGLSGPALIASDSPATHRCVILPEHARPDISKYRVALHLHMHYAELAPEFAAKLSSSRVKVDLIVTTTSDARRLEIEYAFRSYKGGSVRFALVANRGRDISPFIAEAMRVIGVGQYDVVGHLHGKRSLAVDATVGNRWRSYLVDTLFDNLPAILLLFERDPILGLVFAEDRHCVSWGKNQEIAAALARRLKPPPILPDWPVFPIGTMFWARPSALAPLWSLSLSSRDFPPEPLPYDGTILHAIERILPSLCESAKHSWCTVYRKGAGW